MSVLEDIAALPDQELIREAIIIETGSDALQDMMTQQAIAWVRGIDTEVARRGLWGRVKAARERYEVRTITQSEVRGFCDRYRRQEEAERFLYEQHASAAYELHMNGGDCYKAAMLARTYQQQMTHSRALFEYWSNFSANDR